MSRNVQVRYSFDGGETEHEFRTAGRVSNRTYNFLPDKRGFLRTYRGEKSVLLPALPIALASKLITSASKFVDIFGKERLVVVANSTIYAVDGKDFTELFSYPTDIIQDHDDSNVSIVNHSNHLIFLHPGFPPLKWNGDEPINWVGVSDVPPAPEIHTTQVNQSSYIYGADGTVVPYKDLLGVWGALETDHAVDHKQYYPAVYLQSDDAPGEEGIDSLYHWRVAYQNSNGAVGRWSSPTAWRIGPTKQGTGSDEWKENEKAADRAMPIVEWMRPSDKGPTGIGTDITHVYVSRTGNTIADPDAGAYFVQGVYPFTQNRTTDNKAGLSLAVEEDNFPPVKAGIGCSFKGILVFSGNHEDPYGVFYSKPDAWEAWPPLNYYKASDIVTAVLPLSDRVVVVTESTVETLTYDSNNAVFGLSRKDDRRGSILGKSLVVYKDNIFGFFTDGYGIHDGFQYKGVDNDIDEMFAFIDRHNADRINAIIDPKSGYYCCVSVNSSSTEGNTSILYFDFNRNAWYRISPGKKIGCMWQDDEYILLGSVGDFFIFDHGVGSVGAELELAKTDFGETDSRASIIYKTIRSVYLYLGSTNSDVGGIDVEFFVDENLVSPITTASASPRGAHGVSFQDVILDPVWDESIWDDPDSEWVSPRRVWQKVIDFADTTRFHSIRVRLVVNKDIYVEVAGIGYDLEFDNIHVGVP